MKNPKSGESEKAAGGPVLDPAVLERLKSIGGDDTSFLAELIDTFLEESLRLMAQLREAASGGDFEGLRHSAHTLKSNSADFGACALAELCQEMEGMARNHSLDGVMERVRAAEEEYRRARSALETIRGKL